MAYRDPNAVDLSQTKVRLADDVVVWPVRERGQLVYRLEIPSLHRFFRVGYEEYVFISLLDGNTTVPQACGLAAAQLGNLAPTASQASAIQRWLLKNGLAYIAGSDPPVRDPSRPAPGASPKSPLANLNPFWIKLPISRDGRWLQPLARALNWCFSLPVVLGGFALIILGLALLYGNWNRFTEQTADAFSANNWIWLLVTWVVLKIIHELGHALCCRRHGGEVHELGVVLILFAPLAYVDVTSCWRMPNRWKRIAVSSAGMFVELMIAAIALMLWMRTESPVTAQLLHNLILTAGVSTILFNANALMRFDGYFILADLVQIPNLYAESAKEVRQIAKRIVFGLQSPDSEYLGWRLLFMRVYGFAALLWKVVICVSLCIAASTMFAGAGIALAILGAGLWLAKPLIDLSRFCRRTYAAYPARLLRGGVLAAAGILMLFATIYWLPIPTSVRVPAVAKYLPETLVRSRADGFVIHVHVQNNALVREGDLLLELENPELSHQLRSLQIQLEQTLLRQRKATDQHDASARLVLKEQQQALTQQIDQLREQVGGLRLIAPRSGRVVRRNLAHMTGSFVREGDTLLTIARPHEKELLAVIHQNEVAEVREELDANVPVRLAHFAKTTGTLQRIDPRATNRLPAPTLSAVNGGPLAVRAATDDESNSTNEEDQVRLIEPHFPVRIQLTDSVATQIPAGMRTQVAIGYRTDPLATRLTALIRRAWHQAQDE